MPEELPNTPPTFTKEQQDFLNTLIGERIGKTKAQAEKEKADAVTAAVAAATAEKDAELARLQEAVKKGGSGDIEAERAQMKALLDAEKLNAKQKDDLIRREKERADNLFTEQRSTLKGLAIREAMDAQENFTFVDPQIIRQLVDHAIVFDDEAKAWVVKENGVVRQNSSLQPMSVKEYLAEFAAQRPYLVKGQTKGGTGSGEAGQRGGTGMSKVMTKSDLKTPKEKSDYINKFGYDAFATLPAK